MDNRRKNHIALWRKYKQVSAAQLVERLAEYGEQQGLTLPTTTVSLSRIEGGKQNFTMDFLQAVAAVLATGDDDPSPGDLLAINPFSGAIAATTAIEQMSPRQRRIAHGVLQAMLEEDRKAYRAGEDDA